MTEKYVLTAYDPETTFEPRRVEFVKPVSSGDRTDCYWVTVSPIFEKGAFVVSEVPTDLLLLAARDEGTDLRRMVGPTHVYLCTSKFAQDILADYVEPENILMLSWAVISPTSD